MIINFKKQCVTIVCFLFMVLCSSSFASTSIGLIVVQDGTSWIERENKNIPIKIKTKIYEKDIISTSKNGKLQILFNDDTTLTLGNNSTIKIDDFVFNSKKKPKFEANILKGITRVITGQIVENNRDGFMLNTPLATAGIRGTILTAVIKEHSEVFHLNQIGFGREVVIYNSNGSEAILNTTGFSIDVENGDIRLQRETTQKEKNQILEQLSLQSDNSNSTKNINNSNTNSSITDLTDNPSSSSSNSIQDSFSNISPNQAQSDINNQNTSNLIDNNIQTTLEAIEKEKQRSEIIKNTSGSYRGNLHANDGEDGLVGSFGFDIELQNGEINNANMNYDALSSDPTPPINLSNGSGNASINSSGTVDFNIGDFDTNRPDLATGGNMNGNINSNQEASGNWEIELDPSITTPNEGTFEGEKVR